VPAVVVDDQQGQGDALIEQLEAALEVGQGRLLLFSERVFLEHEEDVLLSVNFLQLQRQHAGMILPAAAGDGDGDVGHLPVLPQGVEEQLRVEVYHRADGRQRPAAQRVAAMIEEHREGLIDVDVDAVGGRQDAHADGAFVEYSSKERVPFDEAGDGCRYLRDGRMCSIVAWTGGRGRIR